MNTLSPHPWLFWIGVGAPQTLTAWQQSPAGGVAFVACFYGMLVGSKMVVAVAVDAGRHRLSLRAYRDRPRRWVAHGGVRPGARVHSGVAVTRAVRGCLAASRAIIDSQRAPRRTLSVRAVRSATVIAPSASESRSVLAAQAQA